MSYGSDSSLGVESEDDKSICPLGDTVAVDDETEKNRITNSHWKTGWRRDWEGSMLGAHLQRVGEVPTLESFVLLK